MRINPYLYFNGNTEEVFNFYKSAFGGNFSTLLRFKEMPPSPERKLPAGSEDKIAHVAFPVGDTVLMGNDSVMEPTKAGTNFTLHAELDSKKDVDRTFKVLSAGGKVEMAPKDMFWGSYHCSFTDKFGIDWSMGAPSEKPKK